MSSLHSSHQHITEAWQKLRGQWLATSEQWRDGVHDSFKRKYWEAIESTVLDYAKSLEALAGVIDQMRRNVK
jgi:hypothetical protein